MSANDDAGSSSGEGSWLPLVAVFLAGAVSFGLWQRHAAELKYSTFVRRCPNLSTANPVALRTPEGRFVIVSMIDIPEQYVSTFCPAPGDLDAALGLMSESRTAPVE